MSEFFHVVFQMNSSHFYFFFVEAIDDNAANSKPCHFTNCRVFLIDAALLANNWHRIYSRKLQSSAWVMVAKIHSCVHKYHLISGNTTACADRSPSSLNSYMTACADRSPSSLNSYMTACADRSPSSLNSYMTACADRSPSALNSYMTACADRSPSALNSYITACADRSPSSQNSYMTACADRSPSSLNSYMTACADRSPSSLNSYITACLFHIAYKQPTNLLSATR